LYKEIDMVVDKFVNYLMDIKDTCVNETFLYQFIDIQLQVNNDIPKWAKNCWKGCIFDGMKDLVISSSLERGLKEFFKDDKNKKYCNTPDCMKVCCSDYEEDSSGNPVVTEKCCDSINGDYHELDGNRVDCCTKGSSSVASFNIFDFAKELFWSKTAYAESPQCIVSCKKGYETVGFSCCKSDDTTCICEADPDDERCKGECEDDCAKLNFFSGLSYGSPECGICDSKTKKCVVVYGNKDENCCKTAGGKFCPAKGDFSSQCIKTTQCCPADKPTEKSACYNSCKSGSWFFDPDEEYSGETRLVNDDIWLYNGDSYWVYAVVELFNCGTDEALGIYDASNTNKKLAVSWEDFEKSYDIYF
jgi:hypothetical protein